MKRITCSFIAAIFDVVRDARTTGSRNRNARPLSSFVESENYIGGITSSGIAVPFPFTDGGKTGRSEN
jgi:hypothetical protein